MTALPFHSFVVFAEMRTGSNFLEANLNAIDGIHCYGEAFNPYFIGGEGKQDLLGINITERDADPARLIHAMRVQTPGLSGFRYFHDHDPRVFDLVVNDPGCAKIILTRNHLESYISWKIARESDQWWLANTKHLKTVHPQFDVTEFRGRIDKLQRFQMTLLNRLQVSGQTAFYIDYQDILDLDVLNGLAKFLGLTTRLDTLNYRFKKQNPEALVDKVANPDEMAAGLASIDWFDIDHTPNFEPRRQAAVPQYVASTGAPLLFMPIKSGPEQAIKKWLRGFGPLVPGFDRKSLRQWKDAKAGQQRGFTVIRHPLARAHAAYDDFLRKEWMPELRPYLKRVHKFALPPKGQVFDNAEEYRAGLVVFLELTKHILAGRTELKLPVQFATQSAILQGFSQVQAPDMVIRETRLTAGLQHLTSELGIACPDLPDDPDAALFPLADLYAPDLEAAARETYWRDFNGFGFADWSLTPAK
jgi:hypothetical protein